MGRSQRTEVFHQATQMWRGESHLMAWERVVRCDPCAYCGATIHIGDGRGLRDVGWWGSGTVDHIEPKTLPVRGIGGAHSWINVTGACGSCNGGKSRRSMLDYLWHRAPGKVFRPPAQVRSRAFPTEEAA